MQGALILLFLVQAALPFAASVLSVIVLRKAGFGLPVLVFGILPLAGAALPMLFTKLFGINVALFMKLSFLGSWMSLIPLCLLVVLRWPRLKPGTVAAE